MDLKTLNLVMEPLLLEAPPKASPQELLTEAAVLVLLSEQAKGASFGLIHRPETMDIHPGQISFPGGHIEQDESPMQTALRETEEEIGLAQNIIDITGFMAPMETHSTGYVVWPVVGVLRGMATIKLKEDEADDFFWVPAVFFLNENNHGVRAETRHGENAPPPACHYNGHEIWGLTLRIIKDLLYPL